VSPCFGPTQKIGWPTEAARFLICPIDTAVTLAFPFELEEPLPRSANQAINPTATRITITAPSLKREV
jgi:hypothetical protein